MSLASRLSTPGLSVVGPQYVGAQAPNAHNKVKPSTVRAANVNHLPRLVMRVIVLRSKPEAPDGVSV